MKGGILYRITLLCTGLVLTTALVEALWVFRGFEDQLVDQCFSELKAETFAEEVRLRARLQEFRQDTLFLVDLPSLDSFLKTRSPEKKARLENIFLELAKNKPHYLQVRVLEASQDGLELVRVDRMTPDGSVRIAPDLKPKGHRTYFQETVSLGSGDVSFSKIELNREEGQISQPPTPVLRASSPLYREGKLVAILVVNIDATSVLKRLQVSPNQADVLFTTDSTGEFVAHPDPNKTFQFEYGRSASIQESFPEFQAVFESASNRETLEPVLARNEESLAVLRLIAYDPNTPDRRLGLVASRSLSNVLAASRNVQHHNQIYLAATVLALLGSGLGALLARQIAAPFQSMTAKLKDVRAGEKVELPVKVGGEAGKLARAFHGLLERERAVLNTAADAIVTIDSEGQLLAFNLGAEKMFGYKPEEIVGENVASLMPEEVAAEHNRHLSNYSAGRGTGGVGRVRELIAKKKDGTLFPIELSVGELRLNDRTQFVGIMRDITERKQAEVALRRSHESLARSNAELEQFAHVASHDLQGPLRSIVSFSQLLQRRCAHKLDEKEVELLNFIIDGASRMRELTRDILDLASLGKEAREKEEVQLGGLIEKTIKDLKADIEISEADIEWCDLPTVWGYPSLLGQLFMNLIQNSIKYGDAEESPLIRISGRVDSEGGHILEVSDNGPGIDKRYHNLIFHPFQRVDTTKDGTGIGLSLCKKIVERHGGSISVKSAPGSGTTFIIRLPSGPIAAV